MSAALAFRLPRTLEAAEPPGARGLERDGVRLLVARGREPLAHARFRDLPAQLRPGDLLVVNESATLPAALNATRAVGTRVEMHLSTP
jgi:S-adenosylmethionine:tRNA ribosyltransferase-isomerase